MYWVNMTGIQLYFDLFLGKKQSQGCEKCVFCNTMIVGKMLSTDEKRWIMGCNIVWRDKGTMRRLCKNALMVYEEIKERVCVHSSWLAKPLGVYLGILLS